MGSLTKFEMSVQKKSEYNLKGNYIYTLTFKSILVFCVKVIFILKREFVLNWLGKALRTKRLLFFFHSLTLLLLQRRKVYLSPLPQNKLTLKNSTLNVFAKLC